MLWRFTLICLWQKLKRLGLMNVERNGVQVYLKLWHLCIIHFWHFWYLAHRLNLIVKDVSIEITESKTSKTWCKVFISISKIRTLIDFFKRKMLQNWKTFNFLLLMYSKWLYNSHESAVKIEQIAKTSLVSTSKL